MIPLTLVTGFLGSGKTTFLQNIASSTGDKRIGFVVNEFASVDIDGSRLALPQDRLMTIAGGSIFCKCKTGNFLNTLEKLAAVEPQLDGVIVEASGIADPKVVSKMLAETKMDELFTLARVISLADPGTFYKLIATLPNIRSQVEAADLVIINKTDIHSADEIERTRNEIIAINPDVEIVPTVNAEVVLDIFEVSSHACCDGQYALCRDPNYFREYYKLDSSVDWQQLRSGLDGIDGIYRIKGYVSTADELIEVDYSAGVWNERHMTNQHETGLAVITNSNSQSDVQNFFSNYSL